MVYRLVPLLFIALLLTGCLSKQAEANKHVIARPAFNVPALLGMDIDHVQAALGRPEWDSVATAGVSESTKRFRRDTVLLEVGYDTHTRKVHSYLIRTRHGQSSEYEPLLHLATLTGQDPVLVVVPLALPANPALYTGVKVFLKDGGGL